MLRERQGTRQVLSVSQLTRNIKTILENNLPEVWVCGEVSNLHKASSGHIYFTLKDSLAQISAVFFRHNNRYLHFEIKNGMSLICFGQVGVYEKGGKYQLYVKLIEPKGLGSLQLAFEQLKEKLFKEGLFDTSRKKSIPYLPRRIGIITSSTGAVIHDMLTLLSRRSFSVDVSLFPVRVQGEGAAEEIAAAVGLANKYYKEFDLLVLARGGGSLEDLWAFNEEVLARSIFASQIPTVSAVGHEVDWTISDMVSDMRAPTPSAVIELVIPSRIDLRQNIEDLIRRLKKYINELMPQYIQRLDEIMSILRRSLARMVELRQAQTKGLADRLNALSPLNVLRRGYSLTFEKRSGRLIKDAAGVKVGGELITLLARGKLESKVIQSSRKMGFDNDRKN